MGTLLQPRASKGEQRHTDQRQEEASLKVKPNALSGKLTPAMIAAMTIDEHRADIPALSESRRDGTTIAVRWHR